MQLDGGDAVARSRPCRAGSPDRRRYLLPWREGEPLIPAAPAAQRARVAHEVDR